MLEIIGAGTSSALKQKTVDDAATYASGSLKKLNDKNIEKYAATKKVTKSRK